MPRFYQLAVGDDEDAWHLEIKDRFLDGSPVDIWAYGGCIRLEYPKPVPFAIQVEGNRIDHYRAVFCTYELQFTADELNWVVSEPMGEAPINLSECNPLIVGAPVPFIIYENGRRVDFNRVSYCAIVASDRLADLLRQIVPGEVQFLPATVAGDDGSWWVVNVLSRVDCIDHKRSKITYYPDNHAEHPGEPRGVLRLVLDPERIGDRHILRPRGWEVATVVSETVKRAMEDELMTGMQFVPVTE